MNQRERQAWIIAASVFVTLFLFLPPLLGYFG